MDPIQYLEYHPDALLPLRKKPAPPRGFKHKDNQNNAHRSTFVNWDQKEFIAWDGEGTTPPPPLPYKEWTSPEDAKPKPQPYVLLANSKGQRIHAKDGLSTKACFEFLLQAKQMYPKSIFIGFSINYDINMWLKDGLWDLLQVLYQTNETNIMGYYVKWLPGKSLNIKHNRTGRSVIIYDVFGFFQSSFLTACYKYFGEDDPTLRQIEEGKASRNVFTWEELNDKIIPYNDLELKLLVEMMNMVRKDLHDAGVDPSQWHGPGAVANKVLAKNQVPVSRTISGEILDASQYAYAGGRFEQFWVGRHPDTVYEYDIRSAYPSAATSLPDLSEGYWEHAESFQPETFGVWRIDYESPRGQYDSRPQPLFCRGEDGSVSYPTEVHGWYWTPEAAHVPSYVKEGYVFRPSSESRPFAFIEELYERRRVYKDQGNSTERAIKLILNSLYGKLAQTIGAKNGPPRWHQLEYAGFITSATRAKVYEATLQAPDDIIAIETDAVFSKVELDLPIGKRLGEWELSVFDEITYIQSGFYYAVDGEEVVCRYRGMDRDRETQQPVGLPFRTVLDHLRNNTGVNNRNNPPLLSLTTRFNGLGLALQTSAVWRAWEQGIHQVSLDQDSRFGKRYHVSWDCETCDSAINMYRQMHRTKIGGVRGISTPRAIPWREVENAVQLSFDEQWEIDPQMVEDWTRIDSFQPQ